MAGGEALPVLCGAFLRWNSTATGRMCQPAPDVCRRNTLLGMMTGTSADAQERELARLTRPLGQLPGDEDAANAMMSLSSSPPGPSPNPSEVAPAHGWWHGTWSEMARAGAAPAGGSEGALGVSIGPFGGSVGPLGVSMGALAAGEVDDGRGVVTSPAAPSAAVSPSHGPGGSSDGSVRALSVSAFSAISSPQGSLALPSDNSGPWKDPYCQRLADNEGVAAELGSSALDATGGAMSSLPSFLAAEAGGRECRATGHRRVPLSTQGVQCLSEGVRDAAVKHGCDMTVPAILAP